MTQIDWSKAPAHATHWCPGNAKIEAGFIYAPGGNGGELYSCYADKGLEHIPDFPDWRKARLVPRPVEVAWSGEGLPPAETVVELRTVSAQNDWGKAKIKFASRNVVVWDWEGEPAVNGLCTAYAHAIEMRPIPTPEQIAEAERAAMRESDIHAILEQMPVKACTTTEIVGWMLDQGYRKQVTP